MNLTRLPGVRLLAAVGWLSVIACILAWALHAFWPPPEGTRDCRRETLTLLQSEPLAFLVTRRVVAQIVVEDQESDWMGDSRSVLWATVHVYYGIDLEELTLKDIHVEGKTIAVKLPPPRLLEFTIVPDSLGYLSKSTAVPKVLDLLHNGHRRRLEQRLRDHALEFARENGLIPSRDEILRQLNDFIGQFESRVPPRFRFVLQNRPPVARLGQRAAGVFTARLGPRELRVARADLPGRIFPKKTISKSPHPYFTYINRKFRIPCVTGT